MAKDSSTEGSTKRYINKLDVIGLISNYLAHMHLKLDASILFLHWRMLPKSFLPTFGKKARLNGTVRRQISYLLMTNMYRSEPYPRLQVDFLPKSNLFENPRVCVKDTPLRQWFTFLHMHRQFGHGRSVRSKRFLAQPHQLMSISI